ncbi:hypothetical protein B0H16DRAFT_1895865 [Mycena metata]|uniref:F-box domain-containing protein n=1 Tax=Mycena metata TaxID=1033252 RepID=A0AAD7HMD5_9AGAR|nr:hypothetical protein B0H16DRAFT_1895865 [Mycena metata]
MRFDDLRRELALVEAALESVEPSGDTSSLVERKTVVKLQLASVLYPDLEEHRPLHPCSILSTGYDANVTFEAVEQGIDRWFGRASALPISLSFFGYTEQWYKYVKTLLHQQASRIATLSLVQNFDLSTLGETIHFPILRSLTLPGASSGALITTFRDTPQLQEVNFSMGIRTGPRDVALPWHQLTTFSAICLRIVDCLKVLRDCPLLRKCSLEEIHDAEHWPVSPVLHGTLEELTIGHGSAEILDSLDLPILRALTLRKVTIWGTLFFDFLHRSSSSLRTLTYAEDVLRPTWATSGISLEWFRIANRLVEVTLKTAKADFLHTLLLELDRSAHPKFFPELHHLELTSRSYLAINAPIIAALQSRRPICEPFIEDMEGAAAAQSGHAVTRSPDRGRESKAATLDSLRLIRLCYNYDLDWEEIGEIDWDALYMMGVEGMDIYVGFDKENFLWEW